MALPRGSILFGEPQHRSIWEKVVDWYHDHCVEIVMAFCVAAFFAIVYLIILTVPRCPKCNEHINNKDNFCKHCGEQLRVIRPSE